MLELEVILDFNFLCCTCCHHMGVTLKCAGKGLAAGADARAATTVRCPTCDSLNRVIFAPDGTLHDVQECPRLPEPSMN